MKEQQLFFAALHSSKADTKQNKKDVYKRQDQDGAHIRAILLTFFFRYMRALVSAGHVFIGMPPLYRVQKGSTVEYCYDDAALPAAIRRVGRGYTLQRYKGLGEMNPEQLDVYKRQVFAQFFLVALAAEFRFAADAALNFPAQPEGFFYARFLR